MKKIVITLYIFLAQLSGQSYIGKISLENIEVPVQIKFEGTNKTIKLIREMGRPELNLINITDNEYQFTHNFIPHKLKIIKSSKSQFEAQSGHKSYFFSKVFENKNKEENKKYAGEYRSTNRLLLQINFDNGWLQAISPLTRQIYWLTQISSNEFLAENGHKFTFKDSTSVEINTENKSESFEKFKAYEIKEVWINVGLNKIYGKLYKPVTNAKTPACLILQGGGASNIENYTMDAKYFAMNGITTLLCDKAGVGKSTGPTNYQNQTFIDKTKEYWSLFSFLKNVDIVDKDRVGVCGLSEGGRLAITMGNENLTPVAFVIAIAGPIATREEQQLFAIQNYHRQLGVPENKTTEANTLWKMYFDGIKQNLVDENYTKMRQVFDSNGYRMILPPLVIQLPNEVLKSDLENILVMTQIKNMKSPILFQYGENDDRVDQLNSIRRFNANKTKGLIHNILIYPRVGHSFTTPEFLMSKGYMHDKINWLKMLNIL